MPYSDARTMQDFFTQRAVKTTNIIVDVVASLGTMALVLAMVGLYALVAYSVSRRSREIGIRMAIGADRQGVLRMVLRQGLVLGSIGVGTGLILSYLACRTLTSALWILASRSNYAMLPAIAAPLLLVTLLAAYVPARRASLIDPMRALRDE
jgi:ABC-type antimicrobial peptide transport system permease subunit